MARIRTIKPEFFTSLTIADLPLTARLTFIGLWTHVDDEGRCVDDPRLIKAAVWPLDDRTAADIEADLQALSESSLITRYTLNRKRYLAVTGWDEHQRINRPTRSKLPAPEQGESPDPEPLTRDNTDSLSPHTQLSEDSPLERNRERNREQGKEQGEERAGAPGVQAPAAAAAPPRPDGRTSLHTIPDDFHLNDTMRRWATAAFGQLLDPQFETDQFVSYWRSEGRRKSNWPDAWQKWMRDSAKRAGERRPTGNVVQLATGRPLVGTDAKVAGWSALTEQLRAQEERESS